MPRQLFGEDEDAVGELEAAEEMGENGVFLASCLDTSQYHNGKFLNLAQEIATLKKEAQAFKNVRQALRSATASGSASRMVFEKVSWCHPPVNPC